MKYNEHEFTIQIEGGFACIYVDGKYQFRVKYPQAMTPEQYAKEFIDKRFRKQAK